jgi:hypothetical protein
MLLPPAATDQSAGDGEDEGGARKEEMLPCTGGPQGEGMSFFLDVDIIQVTHSLKH